MNPAHAAEPYPKLLTAFDGFEKIVPLKRVFVSTAKSFERGCETHPFGALVVTALYAHVAFWAVNQISRQIPVACIKRASLKTGDWMVGASIVWVVAHALNSVTDNRNGRQGGGGNGGGGGGKKKDLSDTTDGM